MTADTPLEKIAGDATSASGSVEAGVEEEGAEFEMLLESWIGSFKDRSLQKTPSVLDVSVTGPEEDEEAEPEGEMALTSEPSGPGSLQKPPSSAVSSQKEP